MAFRGGASLDGISSDSAGVLAAVLAGLDAVDLAGGFFFFFTGAFFCACLLAACAGAPASKLSTAEAARKSRLFNRFSGKRWFRSEQPGSEEAAIENNRAVMRGLPQQHGSISGSNYSTSAA